MTSSAAWDGTVKNKVVADGQYYYEIATTIDYEGKEAQKVQVPVIVDTVAPVVTADLDGNKVTFGATDERSGIAYAELLVDGKAVGATNGEEYRTCIRQETSCWLHCFSSSSRLCWKHISRSYSRCE